MFALSILGWFSSFFTEALFFTAIIVGGLIFAASYLGGIFYGIRMPRIALIAVPLVAGIGISLSSGAFFYRQAINSAEVEKIIAKEKAHSAGLQKALDEIKLNKAAADRANAGLRIKIAEAEEQRRLFETEVEEYENATPVPTNGYVSPDLARRLRNK